MKTTLMAVVLAAGGMLSGPAWADDLALVLANGRQDEAGPAAAEGLAADLRSRGFTVFQSMNGDAREVQALAVQLRAMAEARPDADRIVIAVTGQFGHTGREAWLMAEATPPPGAVEVGMAGIPVSPLVDLARLAPGQALVLIGTPGEAAPVGAGLSRGPGRVRAPQGVTVLTGPMGELRRILRDRLIDEGMSLRDALGGLPEGVEADGFTSAAVRFSEAAEPGGTAIAGENAYWQAVEDIGTAEALRAYVDRYPFGRFAPQARARLAALEQDPLARVKQIEEELNLSRNTKRQVQRNLSLLGFDPRGIDGLFGRGSRAAIAAWQTAEGLDANGYLTAEQVQRLQRQADVRAAELEREAQLRREAEERADREMWAQIRRNEAGLRRYLRAYPDGVFAEEAERRLQAILDEKRGASEARERAAWDTARQADTADAYRAFLAQHPGGAFADAARARLAELEEEQNKQAQIEAWKREETRVVPNAGARMIVERMLAAQNLDVGKIDGAFDRQTRRALRQFQRARNLPVTGFVSQQTMVLLMLKR
ncbi:peptidoglycan-binding protein [Marimonas lutisalis]|uniref:peptidoglycan-binding protein n=1 Tax=Marimonas lutisalis TaxID=2545756 RepID=UPI0013764901|nr:peptidoglycan-binding protein [Marimonas lutisalis]